MVTMKQQVGFSTPTRRKFIPYEFPKHTIAKEMREIMERNEMDDQTKVRFLLGVVQSHSQELDKSKKKLQACELERKSHITMPKSLFTCYAEKIDLNNDQELRRHYFELRDIIKELIVSERNVQDFIERYDLGSVEDIVKM
ncbi:hypothetical protein QUF56_12155 [Ureibacillus composti]|nr:hypothetical protein [Ureibacillus composti]